MAEMPSPIEAHHPGRLRHLAARRARLLSSAGVMGRDRNAEPRCICSRVGALRSRLPGGAAHAVRAALDLHGQAHLSVPQRRLPPHQGRLRRHRARLGADSGEPAHAGRDLRDQGFRTGLVSDLYHQFKPSKNFWRGFHQWTFIRGQEADAARSGPWPTQEEIDYWVPRELQELRGKATGLEQPGFGARWFSSRILLNMRDRVREEQWFNAQVMQEAARWVEQNLDAERMFLTVESFDPHEPWFVPEHYRRNTTTAERPRAGDLAVRGDAVAAGDLVTRARQLRRAGRDVRPLVRPPDRVAARDRRARPGAGDRHLGPRPQHVGAARLHRQARLSVGSGELRGAVAGASSAKSRRRQRMQRVCAAPRHHGDDARCGRHHATGADRRRLVLGHRVCRRRGSATMSPSAGAAR